MTTSFYLPLTKIISDLCDVIFYIYICSDCISYNNQVIVMNYLLSLLREVKGGQLSDIQNNTNESKLVLVNDIYRLYL